jgi:hypothetical protein
MFKKSSEETQGDLFASPETFLKGRSRKIYENKGSWHNQFRERIVDKIDEEAFQPLYSSIKGAPNSPIKVLVGMNILKEGQGISDEKQFEQVRFDLLTRSALGLLKMGDPVPAESTYYLFRKRIVEYERETGINLLEVACRNLTRGQSIEFNVAGNAIRMDSKLMGSNIAWYSRYELVHETVKLFYPSIKGRIKNLPLTKKEREFFAEISDESGDKIVYYNSREEVENRLLRLGVLMYKLIKVPWIEQNEHYQILKRVFEEQFELEDKKVIPRPKEKISAQSIQSPHDTDCDYRDKGGNKVKGYSVQVAETCDEDSLNLIVDVQLEPASKADNDFFQSSIENAQEAVTEKINMAVTDGAYHSVANQEYCKEHDIMFIFGKIQGKIPRYDLVLTEGELIVTDTKTNTIIIGRKAKCRKTDLDKWAIRDSQDKLRYFTLKDIETCALRKRLLLIPRELLNLRNNVEATIFQIGYHYRHNKSRYRGLIKHRLWALARWMWVNFIRIHKWIIPKNLKKKISSAKNAAYSYVYSFLFKIITRLQSQYPVVYYVSS